MPSAPKDGRDSPLYAPLRRRMLENGDWDRSASPLRSSRILAPELTRGPARQDCRAAGARPEREWLDRQVQEPEQGCGLHGLLAERSCVTGLTSVRAEMARRAEATGGGMSVQTLMTELWPQAGEEVPASVRQEVIGAIRKLLERQIEF
ncbi:hypothetical protein C8Q78DRAFT_1064504 [Trametes maxima]|nr:hypothetical protein C8Q78DRAFT_1064504 [Trametes maxima]